MKHLMSVFLAVLFLISVTHALAEDDLKMAASRLESAISNHFKILGRDMERAAGQTGRLGAGNESEIRRLLMRLCSNRPYVIDATYVDPAGIMKFIEPEQYRKFEGTDISRQEAVILMKKSGKPTMGWVFDSVEGIASVDVEYPVFSRDKRFSGSISLLIRQDEFIRNVARPVEKELGVKCWVMQKDGVIIYETDPTQIGLRLFSAPLYKDYPELISLGKRIVKQKSGTGQYTFLIHGTDKVIKKKAAWKTTHFFNNDWRVVAYRE